MLKNKMTQFAAAIAAFASLGLAGSANAAAPRPGSQAATAALAFNPFTKASAPAASSEPSTLVVASGSSALQAPSASAQAASPGPTQGTTVSIGDVTVVEPDSGHVVVRFPVTLSRPSPVPVQVNYRTRDGSARGNHADYEFASGTLTFPAGSQTQYVSVRIEGDTIPESTERFFVDLSNARPSPVRIARGTGTGTILDNDPRSRGPRITLAVRGSNRVAEGNSGTRDVRFIIYLSESPSRDVTFRYSTANGSATAPSDYAARFGQQGWKAGDRQLSRGFEVPIVGDRRRESNETFTARIFDVQNATIANGTVQITILNDD